VLDGEAEIHDEWDSRGFGALLRRVIDNTELEPDHDGLGTEG
jgi:hypothetical protein